MLIPRHAFGAHGGEKKEKKKKNTKSGMIFPCKRNCNVCTGTESEGAASQQVVSPGLICRVITFLYLNADFLKNAKGGIYVRRK